MYTGLGNMIKSNILVVDDSEISREILISMLEDEYTVYEACNGQEAVDMLAQNHEFYQLVLLDLNMPVLNGYGVLEIMKERDWLRDVPVIIISAEIGQANKMGAVDFFSKPFDRDIVRARIRNVLAIYERYITDSLTGGLNSKGFMRQVENLFQKGVDRTEYEIMFFDIKNFKAVNELTGLENGDRVLCQFYKDLVEAPFAPLAVARIEADHFACLAKRQDDTYDYMDRLCDQRFEQNGKLFQIHVHCGIFHIEEKPMSVSGMIDRARMAETANGDDYGKPYVVYDTAMKTAYIDYAELSSELTNSLENGDFKVYYQPIMDARTGQIASAEALVRWVHPGKGIISPAVFIPVLEKNGYISKLDMYVVQQVQNFQKKRREAGLSVVPVSVNLSRIDFYDEEMMEQIMTALKNGDFPGGITRFEVTESSYAAMEERCMNLLDTMRKQGVKILMDDFGKGYSSLGLLQNCDFDILKIDMDFVRQIGDNPKTRSIVRAIIDMSHQLGLKVVAEGVETSEQLEFLRQQSCDYIQGYYYSRPLPEHEFIQMLNSQQSEEIFDPNKADSAYIRFYYRAGVHYTSVKMQQDAHTDSLAIAEVLKENQAVGIASGLVDEMSSISYVCDFFLSMLHMTFEEFREYTKDSYMLLVAPEDREFYKNHQKGICEYHLMLPDGRRMLVRDVRALLYTQDGKRQWVSAVRKMDTKE